MQDCIAYKSAHTKPENITKFQGRQMRKFSIHKGRTEVK